MATLNLQVEADNDDCRRGIGAAYFAAADGYVMAGYGADKQWGSGIRFTSVTIPKGATITTATLIITGRVDLSGATCNSKVSAEDVDNAGDFSGDDAASFDTRYGNHTTAIVTWGAVPAWSVDEEGADTTSPEIKTVIKEIVDRGSWSSGNAIVLFWEDFDDLSDSLAYRLGWGHAGSNVKAAKLHIEYYIATTVTPPTLSLALTLYIPVLKETLTPSTLALALTSYIPSIGIVKTVTPSTLSLALTLYIPTLRESRPPIFVKLFNKSYRQLTLESGSYRNLTLKSESHRQLTLKEE